MNKKGLSPIIATVLLVSIALILAVIIFLWARNFLSERTVKMDKPIENICEDIDFSAEGSYDNVNMLVTVDIINRGNVPLYGVEVKKKDSGSVTGIGVFEGSTIAAGETSSVSVDGSSVSSGDTLVILPMIIGMSGDLQKRYTCDTNSVEITV